MKLRQALKIRKKIEHGIVLRWRGHPRHGGTFVNAMKRISKARCSPWSNKVWRMLCDVAPYLREYRDAIRNVALDGGWL